jgi:hypothetical protein
VGEGSTLTQSGSDSCQGTAIRSEARLSRRIIAQDSELIDRIETAQRALAIAAEHPRQIEVAKKASAELGQAIESLADARPEEPR